MPQVEITVPRISESVVQQADQFRHTFLHAVPFRHGMIEGFFEPAFAERLLAEFPAFDPKLAMNEMGQLGGKAVNTRIREISPAYQELYGMIGSPAFLDLMSRLSGIPDLIMDPKLYGGGTHDNRHGQELDAHVDFNYDEAQNLHRRLNIIVYLNREWRTEWGGAIEIHSNPWDHKGNQVRAFDPLFNRCVMFETNEYSWHGFPRINLPPEQRHLTRKSISIYLYTQERPAQEIAPMHGTFYVQRPLPEHIKDGHVLNGADVAEIENLLKRRDDWLQVYQKMELAKNRELADQRRAIADLLKQRDDALEMFQDALGAFREMEFAKNSELADKTSTITDLLRHVRVPFTGYVLQTGSAAGVFADGWFSSHAEFDVQPLTQVSGVLLRGWRPESAPPGRIRLTVGSAMAEAPMGAGSFEATLKLASPAETTFRLKIDAECPGRTVDLSVDSRDLVFLVTEIRAKHPLVQTLTKMLG